MDTATTVAVIGLCGTCLGVIATLIVAIMTNKREKTLAAEVTMEKVYQGRITLRDEQIADLREDLAEALNERDKYKAIAEELLGLRTDHDDGDE